MITGKKAIMFMFIILIVVAILAVNKEKLGTMAIFESNTPRLTLFDFPRDFALDNDAKSGTISLPHGTNLSAVKTMKYTIRGCVNESGARELIINDKSLGFVGFNTCEILFFDDFQHYDETSIQHETLGTFALTSNTVMWKVEDSGEFIIQNHRLTFNEKVGCARSSHCPTILINKKSLQSTCNRVFHQCEVTGYGPGRQDTKQN